MTTTRSQSAVLTAVLSLGASTSGIARAAEFEPANEAKPVPAASTVPSDPEGETARAAGDLQTAFESARTARQAAPSAATWHAEADLLEQMGDFAGAEAAYRSELEALPKDAAAPRKAAQEDLDRVRERARGRVSDEPESAHREMFDARWMVIAPSSGKETSKSRPKLAAAVPDVPPPEPVYRKWYFWVTILALVGSVAAVTVVGVRANRQDRPDALDPRLAPRPMGLDALRF